MIYHCFGFQTVTLLHPGKQPRGCQSICCGWASNSDVFAYFIGLEASPISMLSTCLSDAFALQRCEFTSHPLRTTALTTGKAPSGERTNSRYRRQLPGRPSSAPPAPPAHPPPCPAERAKDTAAASFTPAESSTFQHDPSRTGTCRAGLARGTDTDPSSRASSRASATPLPAEASPSQLRGWVPRGFSNALGALRLLPADPPPC